MNSHYILLNSSQKLSKDDNRKSENHTVNPSEAGSGLMVHASPVGSVHCFAMGVLEKWV